MHRCPGFLFGMRAMTQLKTIPCPRCRKNAAWEGNPDRPFCSARCRLLDLAAWADGEYRVPGEKLPSDEELEK
jgi:uncharacterized protein